MGRSIHNRPSPNRWSIPPARCIEQSTRAKPMERNTSPKILRLAPDSVFVSFPCPLFTFVHFLFCLLLFSFFLAFKGSLSDALPALLKPGGFFNRSLCIWVSHPTHASDFCMRLFFAIICIDMT